MKISELTQPKHRNKLGAIVIIAAIVGLYLTGGFGMGPGGDVTVDISTLGYFEVLNTEHGTPIVAGTLVQSADGITVIFYPDNMDDIADIRATLYEDIVIGYGTPIQGGERVVYNDRFTWSFSLDPTTAGEHDHFIALNGERSDSNDLVTYHIVGESAIFRINNPSAPIYAEAEITEAPPATQEVPVGDNVDLLWRYIYEGPATIELYKNDDLLETEAAIPSVIEQFYQYSYIVTTTDAAIFMFKFIPVSLDNTIRFSTVAINGDPVTFDDPVISDGLEDQDALTGDPIVLSWNYTFEGSAMLNLYIDNVLEDSVAHAGSTLEQAYTYSFIPAAEVDYVIKFEVYPDSSENILVTDIVVISGKTTITTTTTTTTTPPVEPGPDYMLLGIAVAAVVIVGFVILKKRSEY